MTRPSPSPVTPPTGETGGTRETGETGETDDTDDTGHTGDTGETPDGVGLWRFVAYFLRLGATGFGGPIALAGYMQRTLVEERGWISREDYLDGLALAQLAPGPLAAQLAMYLGYVRGGVRGATLVAFAFIAPSLLMVWALSVVYVRFGGLPWMQAVFYGVGAAVIGIITRSAFKLMRLTLADRPVRWAIFLVLTIATAWTEREIVWLFLAAGLVPLLLTMRVRRAQTASALVPFAPLAATAATTATVATAAPVSSWSLLWFFAKAGAFVFGSGLAIVPFLYGGVVRDHHWLTDRQFLDAVAVAMITPGPVVITVAFIGYLVSGTTGLMAAAVGVFLPVYLFVIVPAPYVRRYRNQPQIKAFVEGVTAAATGAIAGAAIVLARRAWIDGWTLTIGVTVLIVLSRWKISELWLIGAAAIAGLALYRW
jgi:chromate transporter